MPDPEIAPPLIEGAPYVEPAVPAKEFPEWYATDIAITSREPGTGTIYLAARPYAPGPNRGPGELAKGGEVEVRAPLWELVSEVPEVAAAFGAIVAAMPVLIARQKQKEEEERAAAEASANPPVEESPEETIPEGESGD